MSKKCINCGAELADNAAFCPHCETKQTEKRTIKQPKLWRKKAMIAAVTVIVVAAVIFGISRYHAPETFEGGAEITYTDADGTYTLFLCFDSGKIAMKQQQDNDSAEIERDASSGMPSQLSVYDVSTGADVQDTFFEKVESCTVETIPGENSKAMDYTVPAKDEIFTEAARVSHIMFKGDSGTNEIRWTLRMKNGDTIILRQTIHVTPLDNVSFSPENAPMDTLEQLQDLLIRIENEISSDTIVNLYLPPVTYDGSLTISNRTVNLFGGTEGENRTTFTGTLTIETEAPEMTTIAGIRFVGNGGTGLSATAAVDIVDCEFIGWDVAAAANDGSWITPMNCIFTDNDIGLHFNSVNTHRSGPNFTGNTFSNNTTAVLLSNVPGNMPIDFRDCTFSGNKTDIDNQTSAKIESTNAIFE